MKNLSKGDKLCGCIVKDWYQFEKLVHKLCGKSMHIDNEFDWIEYNWCKSMDGEEEIDNPREFVYDKLSEYFDVKVTDARVIDNADVWIAYKVLYELVASDNTSIERTVYATKKEAKQMMRKAYREFNKNIPGDMWDKLSYLDNEAAVLFAGGENIYVWEIFRCLE